METKKEKKGLGTDRQRAQINQGEQERGTNRKVYPTPNWANKAEDKREAAAGIYLCSGKRK